MKGRQLPHRQWSSWPMFVLAATGSAIGLGNIWKFPYLVGEHGRGAFVLVYLLCLLFLGIPVMAAEILIGRRGRRNPPDSVAVLAAEASADGRWRWLGWMGMVAGFLILSYYSVIAGWTLAYIFKMAGGDFIGRDSHAVEGIFVEFISHPGQQIVWHSLFMLGTMLIVARGIQGGLEKAVELLTPALFLILLILVGYAMGTGEFMQGFWYLFTPDFSQLTAANILVAMGHAFFTLSLAMGAMLIYGSYLPAGVSVLRVSLIVAGADTIVAIMAGLAIFPLIFAHHLPLAFGPGLIFRTLPVTFAQMPGGALFGGLFFVLLGLAALSSAISLIEPTVAWLVEVRRMSRVMACMTSGLLCWVLGLGTVLSFNDWQTLTVFGMTFFQWLDFLTANVMLPLGGLMIALFVGWIMGRETVMEASGAGTLMFHGWWGLTRFVAPGGVILVFIQALGLI